MLVMKYLGLDGWNRPVYKDQNGQTWKNVNLKTMERKGLCTSNAYGEPDTPIEYTKYKDTNVCFDIMSHA